MSLNDYLPLIISESFIILIISIISIILFIIKPYDLKSYLSKKFISSLVIIVLILLILPLLIHEIMIKNNSNSNSKCLNILVTIFLVLIISLIIILFIKNKNITNPKLYTDNIYYSNVNTIKNDNYHYHFKIPKVEFNKINELVILKAHGPSDSGYDFKITIRNNENGTSKQIKLDINTEYGANTNNEYKNQEKNYESNDIIINKNRDLIFDIITQKNKVYFIVNDKIEEIKILDYQVKDRFNTIYYDLTNDSSDFDATQIKIKLKYKIRYNLLNIENFKNVRLFTNTKKCLRGYSDYTSDDSTDNTLSLLDNCPSDDTTSYYHTVKSCINENKDINFIGCDKETNKCYKINDDVYNKSVKINGLKIKNSCRSGDLKIYKNNYEKTNKVENNNFNIRLKATNKKLRRPKYVGKLNKNNFSDIENCLSKCKTDAWEPNEDIHNKKFSVIPRSNNTYCLCENNNKGTRYRKGSYTFQVKNKV
tara:strand:+ start:1127 stop:2566 length:1440 start_codon:yes stop_codon:yes gene_type:complete